MVSTKYLKFFFRTKSNCSFQKESCQNKKSQEISNPFQVTELNPTDIERKSSKFAKQSGDLFNEVGHKANAQKITEVVDNGFYSALCWVEITTITEFKNGSNNVVREYAISFESPSDIPKTHLDKADEAITKIVPYKIFDQDTKKSEVVNFITTRKSGNETVRQNRKVLCGSGPIYTKEYFEWLNSNRKKIEIRVSPKKQSLIASKCQNEQQTSDSGITSFSTSTVPVTQKLDDDPHKVTTQTKLLPSDETTSITARLGSENIKFTETSKSGDGLHNTFSNLNNPSSADTGIEFKMKTGWTDSTVSAENYSFDSENLITSTEKASFNSEKPQLDVISDDFSSSSTKNDYHYEGKGTTNTQPHTVSQEPPEGTTFMGKTSAPIVTNSNNSSDNSKDIQFTGLDQNPSTLSSEITISSMVTNVPILTTSSQKLENMNTPKPSEKSWLPASIENIAKTTEEAYVTTNLPQNFTDNPLNVTETPKEWNITFSTEPSKDFSNAAVTNQFSEKNDQQLNIPLNDTVEKISVRVNVLTDHILEGTKDGIFFRNITPLIGVEKKIELNLKFRHQALETYKKELSYNWDKFMQNLILGFFGKRTNESLNHPNGLNNTKTEECKNKVADPSPNYPFNISQNVIPGLTNLNNINYGNGYLAPNQQINNLHWWYQNQQKPAPFNKFKENFEAMHTFTYPPMNKLHYSKNSATLFENKIEPENATNNFVNHSLISSRIFDNLQNKPISTMLHKVLNFTRRLSGESQKNDDSSHHPGNATSRIDLSLPLVGDEEQNPAKYIFQKLKAFHQSAKSEDLTNETTQNSKKVKAEEKAKNNTKPGYFNHMFGIVSTSFSPN